MAFNIVKGIYRHTKSQNLYEVIGTARSVDDPHKTVVVYKQLYPSIIKNTDIILPLGSLWFRDYDEFTGPMDDSNPSIKRFVKIDPKL